MAHEVEQLGRDGYFVRHDYLDAGVSHRARAAMRAMDGFAPAQMGRGADRQRRDALRGDELCWLDPTALHLDLLPVLRAFEGLKDLLNEGAFLGLNRLELQGARYLRSGARYARHRDSFRGPAGRRLTCIYYLNDEWIPSDGGCLRLHVAPVVVDIPPRLNSLVVFLSTEVEHEVLASFSDRWALTGWWS
jgi:SM-20-related protein